MKKKKEIEVITMVVKGDLIKMAKEGQFGAIVHGCNAFCTMGAGIAKQIKAEFPEAYYQDCNTKKGDFHKLGNYSVAKNIPVHNDALVTVINAYTQYGFNYRNPVEYTAIRDVFTKINKNYSSYDYYFTPRIGIPKIGAGLAGGDWDLIEKIIDDVTPDITITLVEFAG